MYVEISYRPGTEPSTDAQRESVFRDIRRGLLAAGILKPNDTFPVVHFAPIRYAYVIYDENRSAALAAIFQWLKEKSWCVVDWAVRGVEIFVYGRGHFGRPCGRPLRFNGDRSSASDHDPFYRVVPGCHFFSDRWSSATSAGLGPMGPDSLWPWAGLSSRCWGRSLYCWGAHLIGDRFPSRFGPEPFCGGLFLRLL
jgi:hypothetical protein